MARKLQNRSISFDKGVFDALEESRKRKMMSRSDFVQRCVIAALTGDKQMKLDDVPEALRNAEGKTPHGRQEKPKDDVEEEKKP